MIPLMLLMNQEVVPLDTDPSSGINQTVGTAENPHYLPTTKATTLKQKKHFPFYINTKKKTAHIN